MLIVVAAYLFQGAITVAPFLGWLLWPNKREKNHGTRSCAVLLGCSRHAVAIYILVVLFPPAGATPLPIGPITLTREGLAFAFLISTRLLTFTSAILLLLRTTHPADLVFALTERGLPRSIGYILLVTLQIAPDMIGRATAFWKQRITWARRLGVGYASCARLCRCLGGAVVGALGNVCKERAMALEIAPYMHQGQSHPSRTCGHTSPLARCLCCVHRSADRLANSTWHSI